MIWEGFLRCQRQASLLQHGKKLRGARNPSERFEGRVGSQADQGAGLAVGLACDGPQAAAGGKLTRKGQTAADNEKVGIVHARASQCFAWPGFAQGARR